MKEDVKALLAGALGITMLFAIAREAIPRWSRTGPTGEESMPEIASFLFGPYVLPFELLSVVLLVALVAAILLAQKEGRQAP